VGVCPRLLPGGVEARARCLRPTTTLQRQRPMSNDDDMGGQSQLQQLVHGWMTIVAAWHEA
jgi:hypothetical protein